MLERDAATTVQAVGMSKDLAELQGDTGLHGSTSCLNMADLQLTSSQERHLPGLSGGD